MVDEDGYRPNVGLILCNARDQVLWARRCGHDAWQFPHAVLVSNQAQQEPDLFLASERTVARTTQVALRYFVTQPVAGAAYDLHVSFAQANFFP